jgi:two-component system, NtrC family, sensor kinase
MPSNLVVHPGVDVLMSSEVSTTSGGQSVEELRRELAEARERQASAARELAHALEQQAASADVLRAISTTPINLQSIFDTIVRNAVRLCGAAFGGLHRIEAGHIHQAAQFGIPENVLLILERDVFPLPLTRDSASGRAVLDKTVVHIRDIRDDATLRTPRIKAMSEFRTVLTVPLLCDGIATGSLSLWRGNVRAFSQREIDIVTSFADQAVIAIENARLFEAEQASKRELQESLEYQTAISEVLAVISRSPSDLQPVLEAIVETAARLCQADKANIRRKEGGSYRTVASIGFTQAQRDFIEQTAIQLDRTTIGGRVALDHQTVHVADVLDDRDLRIDILSGINFRTGLGVPLLRKGELIGLLLLAREKQQPFSRRQIALVETFADQAVIAIENTRLFEAEQASKRELTKALEQQTATADVLKVISRSALDVQRVLDALVESAARLCNAYDAVIHQVFGDGLRLVAHHGQIPTGGPVGRHTFPIVRGSIIGRAVIDRRTIHVADMHAEAEEYPESRKNARQTGYRTVLCVPLVHTGEAIGVILIRRAEVRPFTERQIELVNTFADQAVIAIENTRLFEAEQARTRELFESLSNKPPRQRSCK